MYLYIFKEGKIKGGGKFSVLTNESEALGPWKTDVTDVWKLASSGFKYVLPEIELESSISSLYTKDINRVELEVGIIMVTKCYG